MRHWNSETGKQAVAARNNRRLDAALEMGKKTRAREWAGAIVLCGPIVGGDAVTVNLWCEPGQARLVASWDRGRECRMTECEIVRRLRGRIKRVRLLADAC